MDDLWKVDLENVHELAVTGNHFARFAFSQCKIKAIVQCNTVARRDITSPPKKRKVRMQDGDIRSGRRVQDHCITDEDSFCSFGFEERVEEFGRKNVGGDQVVNRSTVIIPEPNGFRGKRFWQKCR